MFWLYNNIITSLLLLRGKPLLPRWHLNFFIISALVVAFRRGNMGKLQVFPFFRICTRVFLVKIIGDWTRVTEFSTCFSKAILVLWKKVCLNYVVGSRLNNWKETTVSCNFFSWCPLTVGAVLFKIDDQTLGNAAVLISKFYWIIIRIMAGGLTRRPRARSDRDTRKYNSSVIKAYFICRTHARRRTRLCTYRLCQLSYITNKLHGNFASFIHLYTHAHM